MAKKQLLYSSHKLDILQEVKDGDKEPLVDISEAVPAEATGEKTVVEEAAAAEVEAVEEAKEEKKEVAAETVATA